MMKIFRKDGIGNVLLTGTDVNRTGSNIQDGRCLIMANGAQPVVKISGYLEKKAKLRIGSPWKKYWFVLEGRLLLYYRSKDEYETLSPCKGSINLCPPCNVKPALSAAGVFQIECRASTVTLRAESRSEQERWMQALLAAIAQSKSSPNRMSHFRYSLDDLPVSTADNQKTETSLSRQNTMPHRMSSSPKKDPKDIIGRLQQMGAQTYGGSLGKIAKLAHKEHKPQSLRNSPNLSVNHSNSSIDVAQDVTSGESRSATPTERPNSKPPRKSLSIERIPSVFVENEQYGTIQEENSIDLSLDARMSKTSYADRIKSLTVNNDLYAVPSEADENSNPSNPESSERTSFMLDNEQYVQGKQEDESNFIRNKHIQEIDHLYERISSDSTLSQYNGERKGRKESVSKIKNIATNLYERISGSSSNSDTAQPKLNEQYSVVHKDTKEVRNKGSETQRPQENEYSLPVNFSNDITDHNKNSLVTETEQYISAADDKLKHNLYSDGLLYTPEYLEYAAIDKTTELEGLYEDPDQIGKLVKERQSVVYHDIEPILPPRPELKSPEFCDEPTGQPKKSKFKMFGQLMKSEKKSEKCNETGKAKPKRRSTSFIRRVWRRKAKSLDAEDDVTYEPVDYELIETQSTKDKTDIQMLQELQKILETRKHMLQEKLNSGENKGDNTNQSADSKENSITEENREGPLEFRTVTSTEQRPSLPPRQNSQSPSPYHDIPQTNKTVELIEHNNTLTNNSASNSNDEICQTNCKIKTIDEILKDLDEEKSMQESRQKVKQLIEKFNDIQNEEEVVLRKKIKFELCKSQSDTTVLQTLKINSAYENINRESDELTQLLEELSKVTCAPVLTPGATSSLVTPVLTDDEWLQLIPIRRRRMSDPDYDIPRPHRSLQLHGRTKQVADNPIPATRFFGPILPPSTNDDMVRTSLTSMDPDSLELENLPSALIDNENDSAKSTTNTEKDYSVSSYPSYDYLKDDKIVYAHPKTVILGSKLNGNADSNIYSNMNFNNRQNSSKMNERIDKFELDIKTIAISTDDFGPFLTKTEETFIDSLEPLAEASTAF